MMLAILVAGLGGLVGLVAGFLMGRRHQLTDCPHCEYRQVNNIVELERVYDEPGWMGKDHPNALSGRG
ncbi:MAG: hypothetical protein GEU99_21935 [Luteitalea sp.]|nr:hypothetical protein [Luteitalea sp.]